MGRWLWPLVEGHSPLSRAQQTFHGYLPDPTLLKAPHCTCHTARSHTANITLQVSTLPDPTLLQIPHCTLPHCILPDLTLQTPHCQIPHSTMQTALHHLEDKSSHIYYVNIAMHYTMYNIYVYYTYNNTHTAVTVHLHYSWWQCLKGGSLSTTKPKPAKTKKHLKY